MAKRQDKNKTLGQVLRHTAETARQRSADLALIREVAGCAAYLEHRSSLAEHVARAVVEGLEVDVCGLFGRDGEGDWVYLGGHADPEAGGDPSWAAPGLLERAFSAITGQAFSEKGDPTDPQLAVELRQQQGAVGVMVITGSGVVEVQQERSEVLSIIRTQIATLLAATWMFARITDSRRYLDKELRRQTKELREAQEQLHQQEKLASLGQLVTGVSHELNNRLVPMLGYAQLLQGLKLPQSAEKAARSIEKAALGSKQIVDDLLSFARPAKPAPQVCDINTILTEVKGSIAMSYGADCPISLKDNRSAPRVLVDPRQAEQVFHNLMKNAVQALEGRKGGRVRVSVASRGKLVNVTIADNGNGMSEEVVRRIFEPFFSTKGVGKGTGLGLSLSYGLIRANGGDITVESRERRGSRFIVSLPAWRSGGPFRAKAPDKPKEKDNVCSDKSSIIKETKKKVLIVDDEESVRDVLEDALSEEYQTCAVTNADEAREAMVMDDFDVVLMDLRMPETSGPQLFEWVREHEPEAAPRVVFMTGNGSDADCRDFLDAQPNRHILKPFSLTDLTETVAQACAETD